MGMNKVTIITGLTPATAEAMLPVLYEEFKLIAVAERTGDTFEITTEHNLDDVWEYHIRAWAHGFVTGFNRGRR